MFSNIFGRGRSQSLTTSLNGGKENNSLLKRKIETTRANVLNTNSKHPPNTSLSILDSFHIKQCKSIIKPKTISINMDPITSSESDSYLHKFEYDEFGSVVDPLPKLVDLDDKFLSSAIFAKVKEGNVTKESVLIFGKLKLYCIIKDPNYNYNFNDEEIKREEEIKQEKLKKIEKIRNEELVWKKQNVNTIVTQEDFKVEEYKALNISTDIIEPMEDVNYRGKWKVKWKVSYIMIHSVEVDISNIKRFHIILHNESLNYVKKTFECESCVDREMWYRIISKIVFEFHQEYFESLIISSPEIYQFHMFLTKKNIKRAIIISNRRIYYVKMRIGELDDKKIKSRFSVSLENLKSIRSYKKTPNAIGILFDKKKIMKDKTVKGSVSEIHVFFTFDNQSQRKFVNELKKVFYWSTKTNLQEEIVEKEIEKV